MHELKKHKVAIIVSAIILIAAIVVVALLPSIMRRAQINEQFEIAQQYLNDLDYESALLAFTKILEIDPKNEDAHQALQNAYLAYIRSEWNKGNTDNAIKLMSDMKAALGLTEAPFTVMNTQEPTCGAVGLETWTCNLNDDVLERDIPATENHTWNDGVIVTNASFSEEGRADFVCVTCQLEKTEVIPVLVDETLVVNDPNLESVLRSVANKPTGSLMLSDFADCWMLDFYDCHITDISGITPFARLKKLESLALWNNNISDLTPLASLINLNGHVLDNNNISDLTPLANMTHLTYLHLNENNISDLTPLAHLTNLTYLKLDHNNISDLTALANLTNLETLSLCDNNITDITPLANLTNLTELDLDGNNITDWSPVAHVANVRGRP